MNLSVMYCQGMFNSRIPVCCFLSLMSPLFLISSCQEWVSSKLLPGLRSKRWDSCIGLPSFSSVQFSSFKSLSCVWLFATPWIAAHQASLSITNPQSSLKIMSIESVMPSSHLILYRPLLLLPLIPPSIWVFSKESTLRMRWPKYWSFSFSISPSNEHPGLVSFRM